MSKLERLEAGTNWVRSAHIENLGRQRLDYEYRMVCSAHYYGKDCNTLCRSRDDKHGHYTCDSRGLKQCLPGWQKDLNDDYCTKGKAPCLLRSIVLVGCLLTQFSPFFCEILLFKLLFNRFHPFFVKYCFSKMLPLF